MSVALGQLHLYGQVSPAEAMRDIVSRRVIFLGDTSHPSLRVCAGLLELNGRIAAYRQHRDYCCELSPDEFRHAGQWLDQVRLAERQNPDFLSPGHIRTGDPVAMMNAIGWKQDMLARWGRDTTLQSLGTLFLLASARRFGQAVHGVDYAEKQEGEAFGTRLARDPEVAANIWYAARTRPVVVNYGTLHLGCEGIPAQFDPSERSVLHVYASRAMFRGHALHQTLARVQKREWPKNPLLPDYVYLADRGEFLRHRDHALRH